MAKSIITEIPKSKIWGKVAIGASVVGAVLIVIAIRENWKANKAQAKNEELNGTPTPDAEPTTKPMEPVIDTGKEAEEAEKAFSGAAGASIDWDGCDDVYCNEHHEATCMKNGVVAHSEWSSACPSSDEAAIIAGTLGNVGTLGRNGASPSVNIWTSGSLRKSRR